MATAPASRQNTGEQTAQQEAMPSASNAVDALQDTQTAQRNTYVGALPLLRHSASNTRNVVAIRACLAAIAVVPVHVLVLVRVCDFLRVLVLVRIPVLVLVHVIARAKSADPLGNGV